MIELLTFFFLEEQNYKPGFFIFSFFAVNYKPVLTETFGSFNLVWF